MATILYLRADNSTMSRGESTANFRGTTSVWLAESLSTTAGATNTTDTASTASGPVTIEVGSTLLEFISPPLAADATISGAITARLCGSESSTAANASLAAAIYKINSSGTLSSRLLSYSVTFTDTGDLVTVTGGHNLANGDRIHFSSITSTTGITAFTHYYVISSNTTAGTFQVSTTVGGAAVALTTNGSGTLITEPKMTAELTTTIAGYTCSTFTPFSSFTILKGERIRVVVYATDAPGVTMASTYSTTLSFNNSTTTYNSYVQFNENLTFQTADPTTQTIYPLSTAYSTGANSVFNQATLTEYKMWTSRGAASTTAVTNTTLGPVNPIQATATAGGTAVSWFSPPLKTVTLAGLVKLNIRGLESSTSANAAVRAELAITDPDGLNPVVWAASNANTELATTDGANTVYLSGQDTVIANGQRLELTLYIDDASAATMASGFTATLSFNGGSANAAGDTYMILPVTLTEVLAAQNTPSAVAGAYAPTIIAGLRLDNTSESHTGTTGSISQTSFSWSHAGDATNARAVVVSVFNTLSSSNIVSSVTYGSSPMKQITEATATDTVGEPGSVVTYFLGSAVPQGTQTVTVNRTNNTNELYAVAVTLKSTDVRDTEIGTSLGPVDANIVLLQNDGTMTEQNIADGAVTGTSVRMAAAYSGSANVPTAGTSSTVYQSATFGVGSSARSCALAVENDSYIGTNLVGFNFATSDDRAVVHLAVRYVPGIAITVGNTAGSIAAALEPSKKYVATVDNTSLSTALTSDNTVIGSAIIAAVRAETTTNQTSVYAPSKPITINVDNTASATTNLIDVSFGLILNAPRTETTTVQTYAPAKYYSDTSPIASTDSTVYEPSFIIRVNAVRTEASAETYVPNKPQTITQTDIAASSTTGYSPGLATKTYATRTETSSAVYSPVTSNSIVVVSTTATASSINATPKLIFTSEIAASQASVAAPTKPVTLTSTIASAQATSYIPTKPVSLTSVASTAQTNVYAPIKPITLTGVSSTATANVYIPSAGITLRPPTTNASAQVIAPPAQIYITWAAFAGPEAELLQVVVPTPNASASVYAAVGLYQQSLDITNEFTPQMTLVRKQNISFNLQSLFESSSISTVRRSITHAGDLLVNFFRRTNKNLQPDAFSLTSLMKKAVDSKSLILSTFSTVLKSGQAYFRDITFSILASAIMNKNVSRVTTVATSVATLAQNLIGTHLTSSSTLSNDFTNNIIKTDSINSALVPQFKKISTNYLNIALSNTIGFIRTVDRTIDVTSNYLVTMQEIASRLVSLSIQSTYEALTQSRTLKTFQLILKRYLYDSSLSGGSSSTLTFDDILDASSGSSTVDGNPLSAWVLTKNVGKYVPIASEYSSLLSNQFIKLVHLAISSLFNADANKLVYHTISISQFLNIALQKIVTATFQTLNGTFQTILSASQVMIEHFKDLTITLNTTSSILKTAQYAISLQSALNSVVIKLISDSLVITSQFTSSFISNVRKYVAIYTSTTSIANKQVSTSINYSSSWLINLSTQSLRFITLALVNSFTTVLSTQALISRLLSIATTLTPTVQKHNKLSALISASLTTNTTKTATSSFNISLTTVTALAALSARWVYLSIIDSFAVAASKQIKTSLLASFTATGLIRTAIATTLSLGFTVSTNLLTQSLRFVTFSVLSSFNIVRNSLINSTINLNESFSDLIQKLSTNSITTSPLLNTNRLVLVSRTLNLINSSTLNINKGITNSLPLSLSALSTFNRQIFKTVNISLTSIINLTAFAAYFLYLAIVNTFNVTFKKYVVSSISTSFTGSLSFQKSISKFLINTITASLMLLTQSLRFVTLSILSGNSTVFAASINKFVSLSSSLTDVIKTYTAKSLPISSSASSTIAQGVATTQLITSTLASNIIKTSTFRFTINEVFTASLNRVAYFYRTLTQTTNLATSTQVLVKSFVNVSSTYATQVIQNVGKSIASGVSTVVNLSAVAGHFISMAIMNAFNIAMFKNVLAPKTLLMTQNTALRKLVDVNADQSLSANVLLLTQSLNFVRLSVIFASQIAQSVSVKFGIAVQTTFGYVIQKLVRSTINGALTAGTTLINAIQKLISTSTSVSVDFIKSITNLINVSLSNTFSIGRAVGYALRLSSEQLASVNTISFRLITASITSLFDTTIQRTTKTSINVSASLSTLFRRLIDSSLRVSTSFNTTLLTQSLRFVYFAVTNSFSTVISKLTNTSLNILTQINIALTQLISKTFTLSSSFATNFTRTITNAVNLSNNFDVSSRVALSRLITLTSQLSSSITTASAFFRTINVTSSMTIKIIKETATRLTLSINNLFNSMTQSNVFKAVSASSSFSVSLYKLNRVYMNLNNTFAALLLPLSLRYVTFSLASSLDTTNQINVRNSLNTLINDWLLEASTSLPVFLDVMTNLTATTLKNVQTILEGAILTSTNAVTKSATTMIALNASYTIEFVSAIKYSLSVASTFFGTIVKAVSTSISIAINNLFEALLQKRVSSFINNSSNLNLEFNKAIQYSMDTANSFATLILTQSQRFVNFILTSSYSINQFIKVDKSVAFNLLTDNKLVKLITSTFSDISSELFTDLDSSFSLARILAVTSDYSTMLMKGITFQISNALTLFSEVSVALSIALNQTMNDAVQLIKASSRGINLALINAFDTALAYRPIKNLTVSTINIVQSSRNIAIQILLNISAGTTLLNQSLRFITMNLLNTFNPSDFKTAINKTIAYQAYLIRLLQNRVITSLPATYTVNLSSSILVRVNRLINSTFDTTLNRLPKVFLDATSTALINSTNVIKKALDNGISFATSVSKNIPRVLTSAIDYTLNFSKSLNRVFSINTSYGMNTFLNVGKSISQAMGVTVNLLSQSLRFVTMSLLSLFEATPSKNVGSFEAINLTNINTISRAVATRLNYNLSNAINFAKTVSININGSTDLMAQLFKGINKFVVTAINLVSTTITTETLRFITLAIVESFEIAQSKNLLKALNTLFSAFVQINVNTVFSVLLEVLANLPVRRSHTLYSALTSFAVNKSTSGSEGSAQEMQRKSGGSARKRNINNSGSTLFRRGNTDDLD